MKNINLKGAKFIVYTWGPKGYYVTEKRGFTTRAGAESFAAKQSGSTGILEVSVCIKLKSKGQSVPTRIALYRKGELQT